MKFFIASLALFALVGVSTQNCTESFKKAFLSKANELRAKHGVEPLSFNNSLNTFAQDGANMAVDSKEALMERSNDYGENRFMSWSPSSAEPSGEAAVEAWYTEEEEYDSYGEEPDMSAPSKFDFFTQLVWKDSQKVGVGCSQEGRDFYVVANFSPAGNKKGSYAANVLAPK